MAIFTELEWRKDRIAHILGKHGVTPGEVEEACFGDSLILKGPGKGERRLYYALGQTESGRYLFVVLKPLGQGNARVITARDMTEAQRKRYQRR